MCFLSSAITRSRKRYEQFLKGCYQHPLPDDDKLLTTARKHYIELAVISKKGVTRKQADEFTKKGLHGLTEEILLEKALIVLVHILNPRVDGRPVRCLLVEGATGIGKSTLAWEVCHMWEELESVKQYDLGVLVGLREKRAQKVCCLEHLLLCDATTNMKELVDAMRRGKGMLFVFDGFDELPREQRQEGSVYIDLLKGRLLPETTIIVTSRPSVSAELWILCQHSIDRHLKVVGFTKEEIRRFAESMFSGDILAGFLSYITSNLPVYGMMYNPLKAVIVALIYQDSYDTDPPFPTTATELFYALTCGLIRRHLVFAHQVTCLLPLSSGCMPLSLQHGEDMSKLPRLAVQQFFQPAIFAYKSICERHCVFTDLGEDFEHFGTMKFVTNLQQMYSTSQPPTWDPLPQCQYVELTMTEEKGKRFACHDLTAAHSRAQEVVDLALASMVTVDTDKIFDVGTFEDERQVILIEGMRGMGKTSLAYHYAMKWAEGKISTFDAVALVHLRDLNEHDVHDVDRILPHLLFLASGNSMSKEMARLITDKHKILLILDGWDESPASICKPSFITDLLRSQTRILITSRSDISLNLHGLANQVKILGFTKDDIHDYFENALKSSHYTDTPLSTTMTQLFDALTCALIHRHLVSMSRVPSDLCIPSSVQHKEDVSKLPPLVAQQFLQLAKVAYESICMKMYVFTDLGEYFEHLGTMKKTTNVNVHACPGNSYNFLHLTLQEYLALHNAIENPSDFELVEWLQNHNIDDVRFLVGILFHHDDYHSHPLYQKITEVYQKVKTTRDGSHCELCLAELVIDEVYPHEAELLIHAQGKQKCLQSCHV